MTTTATPLETSGMNALKRERQARRAAERACEKLRAELEASGTHARNFLAKYKAARQEAELWELRYRELQRQTATISNNIYAD